MIGREPGGVFLKTRSMDVCLDLILRPVKVQQDLINPLTDRQSGLM
jgi:hypothetical protein